MGLGFDNSASTQFNTGSANLTQALTVGSGSNRVLNVKVWCSNGSMTVSGVKYAGVSMTQVNSFAAASGGWFSEWFLANPASGANNVVVTTTLQYRYYQVESLAFSGASPATPTIYGGASGTAVTSLATSLTTTVDGSWIAMQVKDTNGFSKSAGANTTRVTDFAFYGGPKSPAGAFALNVNIGSSDNLDTSAIVIAPAPTAKGRLLL